MKFLIRVDDIGMTPEETKSPPWKKQDFGLEVARRFNDAMHGVPWLAACVPAMVEHGDACWLAVQKNITVALHGWNHREVDGARNEFEGKSVDRCREIVAFAQSRFHPSTPYFVPPWNAFTTNFVEAAWHEGIRHIFGAPVVWPTPPSPVEIDRGVKLWPAWACIYGALAWEQGSSPILKILPDIIDQPGKAVLTLHITWEAARDPEFQHTKIFSNVIGPHAISAEEFVK